MTHATLLPHVELGHRLTPVDCGRTAARLATTLRRHGVASGDRVLLLGDNSPEYVAALLALVSLGRLTGAGRRAADPGRDPCGGCPGAGTVGSGRVRSPVGTEP